MRIRPFLSVIAVAICITKPAFSQSLKPGDVHPNAKVIDADHLYPFNEGAATIDKGNAKALIDKEGNFIAAYNKYDIRTSGSYNNGFILTNMGIMTSKGKMLVDQKDWGGWGPVTGTNFLRSSNDAAKTVTYMDAEGKKYVLTNMVNRGDEKLREGIIMIYNNSKIGYKTIKNEIISQPVFDVAEPFFDGMAMVGKTDPFGEVKYGFIDRTGKQVIPIMYSVKPENFHAGLAKVTPKDKTDFEYAYVDKDGKIVVKFLRSDIGKYGMFYPVASHLYVSDKFIMDGKGKLTSHTDFLAQYGISLRPGIDKGLVFYPTLTQNWAFSNDPDLYDDGKIRFIRILAKPQGTYGVVGFVDLATKNVVEATFTPGNYSLYFDPVSKLAYAEMLIGHDEHKGYLFRKGYINEQGIFMIVKGEEGKW